uniref:Rho GTPase-activating protein 39 n=1 Tax=Syphacia muris TaxID=451379 RepID=A0A0N5AGR4_9BILA
MENGIVTSNTDEDNGVEWVEIVEPQTKQQMYANLRTGECAWEPPPNVPVKRNHSNQWWELFDSNTQRFYYYNANSMKTVWQRPQNCDIIPLAKLQSLKENTESPSTDLKTNNSASSREKTKSTKKNSETQTSPKEERRNVACGLVNSVYAQNISPDFGIVVTRRHGSTKISFPQKTESSSSIPSEESSLQGTVEGIEDSTAKEITTSKTHAMIERFMRNQEAFATSRPSEKPRIELKSSLTPESLVALYESSSSASDSSKPTDPSTSHTLGSQRFPVDDVFDKTSDEAKEERIKARAKITQNLELLFGGGSAPAAELTPAPRARKVCIPKNPTVSFSNLPVPTAKPTATTEATQETPVVEDSLKNKEKEIRASRFCRSEQSAESWTKDGLKQPLTFGENDEKSFKKEALSCFKIIQSYMGDRKTKQAQNQLALTLCEIGYSRESIADELFCQLIKQLTSNEKRDSLRRGWELLAIFLSFFGPHNEDIIQRLTYFIDSNSDHLLDPPEVPVSQYATQCFRRLRAVQMRQEPSLQRIQESRVHIFSPPQFSASLEDLMSMQAQKFPERKLPWIETILIELILSSDGEHTEGLFRVPANPDHVNTARLRLDRGLVPVVRDAHVPAALLKLWLRLLPEPLIPVSLYTKCLDAAEKPEEASNIVDSLPALNRLVLVKILDLLQVLANEEVVKFTKMDACNLAMVIAPNILRSGSDDPRVIFDNTRRELNFLKTLIGSYDASYIREVV